MRMAEDANPGDENAAAVSGGGSRTAATPEMEATPDMEATPGDETVVAGSGVPGLLAKP
jgi:hypothetical protein